MLGRRVCVIGAGLSGLGAVKSCLEDELEPVCFERTSDIGGLWHYREETNEGVSSVMRSTVINSSKELSAFSDFPPPEDFPNFMHNEKMNEYIRMYADHFNLVPHIRFNHSVIRVDMSKDYDSTGQWDVQVQDKDGNVKTETFGAVMVCNGHHVFPHSPEFPGLKSFKGRVVHTHTYKKPNGYEGKKVLVIGIGNSGGDVAVELSRVAKQVYLSTRKGTWVLHRVDHNGYPMDVHSLNRFIQYSRNLTPWACANSMFEAKLNMRFDHSRFGLKPKHRVFAQHPMINDDLPNRIMSGTLKVKHDVDHFTEKGVVFKDDKDEFEIDEVILATGYNIKFPFLEKDVLDVVDNEVNLYKFVFPPHLTQPTIAIIGLIQPLGSVGPISEMQSRWATRVFKGLNKLPSKDGMQKDIDKKRKEMQQKFDRSQRHTVQVTYIPYVDEIASLIGARPNFGRLLFTDPKLLYHVIFSPCVPYQYRLNGPHRWEGAVDAIITTPRRVNAPLQTRHMDDDQGFVVRFVTTVWGILMFLFMLIFYY